MQTNLKVAFPADMGMNAIWLWRTTSSIGMGHCRNPAMAPRYELAQSWPR